MNLAIELDGGGHADAEQTIYDEERTKVLNGADIRVLRFWNSDLLNNTEAVLEEIYRQLNTPPHPACGHLLPQGEGF
jgi:very-short-patch-repair endonuclease